ncbi:hypothetical protein [Myxococcus sp. SDU36]|uniref:hypothetical protein n=1 Tax=Myxococcus sp. SDU36 TaxID=2831967 RepID=UPI002543E783|nr:hypothetical protein [Myxococcus sp. SDU36]WIG95016.1 hypothetical protein KGD87_31665 [Myxococcus sp. SDU36]
MATTYTVLEKIHHNKTTHQKETNPKQNSNPNPSTCPTTKDEINNSHPQHSGPAKPQTPKDNIQMKRTTISLILALSTTLGLTACGTDQSDMPEPSAIEDNVSAQACPNPDGYYYCVSQPGIQVYFYPSACGITGITARNECRERCEEDLNCERVDF